MMEAGRLNNRIQFLWPKLEQGEYGVEEGTPAAKPNYCFWAEVRPVRANEVIRSGKPGMETSYVIRMRYPNENNLPAPITGDCKIKWRERTLHIVSVTDVAGRQRELEILCSERELPSGIVT